MHSAEGKGQTHRGKCIRADVPDDKLKERVSSRTKLQMSTKHLVEKIIIETRLWQTRRAHETLLSETKTLFFDSQIKHCWLFYLKVCTVPDVCWSLFTKRTPVSPILFSYPFFRILMWGKDRFWRREDGYGVQVSFGLKVVKESGYVRVPLLTLPLEWKSYPKRYGSTCPCTSPCRSLADNRFAMTEGLTTSIRKRLMIDLPFE